MTGGETWWSVELDRGRLTLTTSGQPSRHYLLALEIAGDWVDGEARCMLSPRELRAVARLLAEAVRAMGDDAGCCREPRGNPEQEGPDA